MPSIVARRSIPAIPAVRGDSSQHSGPSTAPHRTRHVQSEASTQSAPRISFAGWNSLPSPDDDTAASQPRQLAEVFASEDSHSASLSGAVRVDLGNDVDGVESPQYRLEVGTTRHIWKNCPLQSFGST